MKPFHPLAVLAGLLVLATLLALMIPTTGAATPVRVFHAAGLTPLFDDLRPDLEAALDVRLLAEGSGSQVACRKAADLGRPCDLVMVADHALVAKLLATETDWRLDFAADEIVLGVGAHAPGVDEAEEDWVPVLLRDDVRLGRVDENQGPIGYRALLVWKLRERLGGADGLHDRLFAKTEKVVDHVTRLTPLLKTGEVDYAFLYRSICIARDIRYIPLDPRIHLGDPDRDYGAVSVTFEKLKAGAPETVTITAAPVVWSLTMPHDAAHPDAAARLVRHLLLDRRDELARHGFRPLDPPRFFGPAERFERFAEYATRAGPLRDAP